MPQHRDLILQKNGMKVRKNVLPEDESVFWARVNDQGHQVGQKRGFTLSRTPPLPIIQDVAIQHVLPRQRSQGNESCRKLLRNNNFMWLCVWPPIQNNGIFRWKHSFHFCKTDLIQLVSSVYDPPWCTTYCEPRETASTRIKLRNG
jgi:hypothetical protein